MKGREDEALDVLAALSNASPEDKFVQTEFTIIKDTVLEMQSATFHIAYMPHRQGQRCSNNAQHERPHQGEIVSAGHVDEEDWSHREVMSACWDDLIGQRILLRCISGGVGDLPLKLGAKMHKPPGQPVFTFAISQKGLVESSW